MLARLLEMLLYLVIDVLHIGILINGQKLVALEIPRGFVGVPVGFGDLNYKIYNIFDSIDICKFNWHFAQTSCLCC